MRSPREPLASRSCFPRILLRNRLADFRDVATVPLRLLVHTKDRRASYQAGMSADGADERFNWMWAQWQSKTFET